ncbi:MAG TPA: adenylate/guanylate cyclase domain-containing protein [Noviherbaspirillum sp.]|jgi:class 3 adenylate cyclase|uniref:adenylate/guanylate cyclase domain-containing protein n=1 Tax=Noviherbaspirillum sp. TaxID=1926288 RepID=UPI002F935458
MNDAPLPIKQLNRTFIGSVLFIDIVGYSMRTVPDQLEMKELFNRLLADAVHNVAASERIMVDTGDGAGIAFLGDPEDALFAALTLRDAVDDGTVGLGEPGFVRMGINLGPLKIVRDINGHTNMIGDGVNDAQRVMSFAEPGQVMVSHSYYDIISRFSRDYTQLFVYEGTRHDKHVREHEVYRFGPAKDNEPLAEKMRERSRARGLPHADDPVLTRPAAAQASDTARAGKLPVRAGLAATVIGAATIVGAVWSWTGSGKPDGPAHVDVTATQTADGDAPAAAATAAAALPEVPADGAQGPAVVKETPRESPTENRKEPVKEAKAAEGKAAAGNDAGAKGAVDAEPAAPVKPGTVRLAIQPWGEIYVDGGRRGVSPPMKSISLAPGKHRIEIRNGDFTPYKETVEVKSGGETTVQYVF